MIAAKVKFDVFCIKSMETCWPNLFAVEGHIILKIGFILQVLTISSLVRLQI
jgi:hypothetical protein